MVINRGLSKGNDEQPAEIAPELNRGKATAVTIGAMVVGFPTAAIGITAFIVAISSIICVIWGIGVGIASL
jgi:hypothetical protein